jgi:hypothetical protein
MHFIGLVFIIYIFISSKTPLSAKCREAHGIDFAKTVLGYPDWENLRYWNKTLSAKDPLLYTIQIQNIITSAAAIAIDYSGTEGSLSNDFFYLERYFQMKQFSRNKIDIPSIDDFPSIGFGIMHRYFCHSGYRVDKSSAEDNLKKRLLKEERKKKFGFKNGKTVVPYQLRKKELLSSPGRWKAGRELVLVPAVANAFDLNLKRGKQESLVHLISTVVYYTHLLGDYIEGAQEPLPEYEDTIKLFKKDLRRIRILSLSRIKIKAFFLTCPHNGNPKDNAQKTIDKMGKVFPRIIRNELKKRKRTTYHKLKDNRKEAIRELLGRNGKINNKELHIS